MLEQTAYQAAPAEPSRRRLAALPSGPSPGLVAACGCARRAAGTARGDDPPARAASGLLLKSGLLRHQLTKLLKEIGIAIRTRRRFRVTLDAEQRPAAVAHAFQGAVVEVHVHRLPVAQRGVGCHGEPAPMCCPHRLGAIRRTAGRHHPSSVGLRTQAGRCANPRRPTARQSPGARTSLSGNDCDGSWYRHPNTTSERLPPLMPALRVGTPVRALHVPSRRLARTQRVRTCVPTWSVGMRQTQTLLPELPPVPSLMPNLHFPFLVA